MARYRDMKREDICAAIERLRKYVHANDSDQTEPEAARLSTYDLIVMKRHNLEKTDPKKVEDVYENLEKSKGRRSSKGSITCSKDAEPSGYSKGVKSKPLNVNRRPPEQPPSAPSIQPLPLPAPPVPAAQATSSTTLAPTPSAPISPRTNDSEPSAPVIPSHPQVIDLEQTQNTESVPDDDPESPKDNATQGDINDSSIVAVAATSETPDEMTKDKPKQAPKKARPKLVTVAPAKSSDRMPENHQGVNPQQEKPPPPPATPGKFNDYMKENRQEVLTQMRRNLEEQAAQWEAEEQERLKNPNKKQKPPDRTPSRGSGAQSKNSSGSESSVKSREQDVADRFGVALDGLLQQDYQDDFTLLKTTLECLIETKKSPQKQSKGGKPKGKSKNSTKAGDEKVTQ